MIKDQAQVRRSWEVLFEAWSNNNLKARGALALLRQLEKGAAAGKNPWPTSEEDERVENLVRLADTRRHQADDFVHRLLA
ncbi:hypothetical protein [Variovorax sp. OK605]|uniref:hypothetical protein n=1 Tax=Variovorax sp. OK605 TaxID=1855317 RepID=UPI001160678B|nr:hypothetical protein [Variovorax sp. OK605]